MFFAFLGFQKKHIDQYGLFLKTKQVSNGEINHNPSHHILFLDKVLSYPKNLFWPPSLINHIKI